MVSFHANITIPTVIWSRKWQLKYRKSSKHIKRLNAIQKSQIKSDRLKEAIFMSLKEQLMNYWPHSQISQDFPPWKGKSFDSVAKSLGSSAAEPVLWNVAFNNVGKTWVSFRFLFSYDTLRKALHASHTQCNDKVEHILLKSTVVTEVKFPQRAFSGTESVCNSNRLHSPIHRS